MELTILYLILCILITIGYIIAYIQIYNLYLTYMEYIAILCILIISPILLPISIGVIIGNKTIN